MWDSETFTPPTGILPNKAITLATTDTLTNTIGLTSCRVIVEYEDCTPDGSLPGVVWNVTAVLEGELTGSLGWFPIGYQFTPANRTDIAPTRQIILQPDMVAIDAGIDDTVYVGNQEIARISRQQGKLTDRFRLRLVLVDQNPGGAGGFESLTVSARGERFGA